MTKFSPDVPKVAQTLSKQTSKALILIMEPCNLSYGRSKILLINEDVSFYDSNKKDAKQEASCLLLREITTPVTVSGGF